MDNFKNYITESKNTHMTHIEDKVIYGGVKGTREAILALRSLRDMLKGEHDGSVSVKWDGAPAIFAGIDPRDGNFFVAKKGIFNKNPKVYKSNADVDADTSGDLAVKLKSGGTALNQSNASDSFIAIVIVSPIFLSENIKFFKKVSSSISRSFANVLILIYFSEWQPLQ